jgi:IS4 transposase
MSHALKADRLLIRPASGRQAGTGFLTRTNRSKDTRQGHPYAESQTRNTGTNLTRAPDGTPTESQCLRLSGAAAADEERETTVDDQRLATHHVGLW